jgi:predicted nucleic acid-binding Zn ribbon protein
MRSHVRTRTSAEPGPRCHSPVPPPPRDSNAGKPQLVGDLLARVLNRKGLGAKLEAASVLTEWESLVGPQIAAVTRPQRVSEGVLFVGVANSPWLMELNLMKADLMRRLNAGKGDGRIRQIVFVMGTE